MYVKTKIHAMCETEMCHAVWRKHGIFYSVAAANSRDQKTEKIAQRTSHRQSLRVIASYSYNYSYIAKSVAVS